MQDPVASLVALSDNGAVDTCVPPLPVHLGLNTFGRNDSKGFTKQVSREHLSITASSREDFQITVVGPNPVVVWSGGTKKKMQSRSKERLKIGDVIEFLPNDLPFRLDAVPSNYSQNSFAISTSSTNVESEIIGSAACVSFSETETVKKRHIQLFEDEALARLLQEEENRSVVDYPLSTEENLHLCIESLGPGRKERKVEPLSTPSPASFHLLHTVDLPRSVNHGCVRIQDVIEGDVQLAILSNYMVDITWLLSACPLLSRVGKVVVIHGESDISSLNSSKPKDWVLHKPPLPIAYGTHHSKAMILVYGSGVRVIVHTANLIYGDWNNKTQGLWMQDFPLKESNEFNKKSDFENDLVEYLESLGWAGCTALLLGIGETRVNAKFFRMFDFSAASVRLVASVPGYHNGRNLRKWGHMKMRLLLEQEHFDRQFISSPLVYQFSSLGSLDEKWISELTTSMSAGLASNGEHLGVGKVQFVWPTVEDIRCSLEGYVAGNSVPSPQKNVKDFLRKYWARWQADHVGRSRAMPHIKTFVRYNEQSLAWFLLTSSNLSKAAWGALQKNNTQLMIRSYELGVLFLPSHVRRSSGKTFSCTRNSPCPGIGGLRSLNPDEGTKRTSEPHAKLVTTRYEEESSETSSIPIVRLPVPYVLPPICYGSGDVPWSWDRTYSKPDVYGEVWPREVKFYMAQGV